MQSTIYSRSSSSTTTPSSSCSTLNTPTESAFGTQFIPRLLSKASSSSSSLLKREGKPGKKSSYPSPPVSTQSSRAPSFVSRSSISEFDEPITYINAITFDGGGVRGAASAKIVDIIMDDLSKATGTDVHPADYFDMFGGTSTGGLIAIMLGRLRVGTKRLLESYFDLSTRLFRSKAKCLRSIFRGAKYSGKLAERLFTEIVAGNSAEGADATLRTTEFGAPDVFVTAVDADNASGDPVVLRSYDVSNGDEETFAHRIVDAACATTAAPAYFPPKTLGNGKIAIDGGLSVNNPTDVLISEARRKHGRGVRFGLLLSIGTGEKSPTSLPACSSAASLLSFTKALGQIVTDSERTHLRVEERFRDSDLGTYLRINVPGIGDVHLHLDDYNAIPRIVEATEHFMNTPEMQQIRQQIVEVLLYNS